MWLPMFWIKLLKATGRSHQARMLIILLLPKLLVAVALSKRKIFIASSGTSKQEAFLKSEAG
jgi:hypothetical protein